MCKADIGLIGIAVMGENLVMNMERNGFTVAVYNRTTEKVKKFMEGRARGKNIIGTYSIKELIDTLKRPRKVMMMVKAGDAVDSLINQLILYLDKGDIIIDGGNSHFEDTNRRTHELEKKGLLFIGAGISGGEKGALEGPSIMPGGSKEAWQYVAPVFQKIAAKMEDGSPCCQWIGPNGAGHFVKTVHNGIEYGDMQLISEAYYLLKNVLELKHTEMHEIFSEWNKGELSSYLIEITGRILSKMDEKTGKPLVDFIMDTAQQKGTGKWSSQAAMNLGIATPTITEAVFARSLSVIKNERTAAADVFKKPVRKFEGSKEEFIEAVRQALYAAKICSYAQGFALLREASVQYKWNLDYGNIALLWREGCIIRARFLEHIKKAYDENPDLPNLMLAPFFKNALEKAQSGWRKAVITAVSFGLPVPGFTSALSYFDAYCSKQLPANMIQAQRDYFGAHTYQRVDQPGVFHTDWTGSGAEVLIQ